MAHWSVNTFYLIDREENIVYVDEYADQTLQNTFTPSLLHAVHCSQLENTCIIQLRRRFIKIAAHPNLINA